MFTGIIEQIGVVAKNKQHSLSVEVSKAWIQEVMIGSSIAVNGVCLTVVNKDPLTFDVVTETLQKTNLGELQGGDKVNLERAMQIGDRFEGHIVQGHCDGVARITNYATVLRRGESRITNKIQDRMLTIKIPKGCNHYIVQKGSIAIDGISLTVASVVKDSFAVAIIPHTFKNTIVKNYTQGTRVNLEFDIIGKYVEKMLKK